MDYFALINIGDPLSSHCSPDPCNGHTCTSLEGAFECSCDFGYYGDQCEYSLDPCKFKPCLNGGTCESDDTSFTCSCATGFVGSSCGETKGKLP